MKKTSEITHGVYVFRYYDLFGGNTKRCVDYCKAQNYIDRYTNIQAGRRSQYQYKDGILYRLDIIKPLE